MEDSSTNPYIPQESQAIRQKVYEHQSPLGRIVKWLLITTVIVAVLVGGGLFFVVPLTTADDKEARKELANVLQPPEQTLKRVGVTSSVGFQLNYDNRLFSSYAEVGDSTAGTDESVAVLSGNTYENNDLRIKRAYNYVRVRPTESVTSSRAITTQPPELEIFATTSEQELADAAKLPENKDLSKLSLLVKLDVDKREAKKVADDNTVVRIESTKPSNVTINNVEFQKVRLTTTNENYRIVNVKYDECYYTIQFEQPYAVCVSNVRPTNVSAASLVEQVFDSIIFEQPTSSGSGTTTTKTSFVYPLARFAQATTSGEDEQTGEETEPTQETTQTTTAEEGESELMTITPPYYDDGEILKAFAKAQPSVVRVGMLYCADLALKFESGETATTLTDACVGTVSSGVFVSKDGYIATTGHAIRTHKKAAINGYINFATDREKMLERLERLMDYLLKAKIILDSDAEYLMTGARTGDQEALAKVQNLGSIIPDDFVTPVKEEYAYAIQPSDKPIVVNNSDSVKPAFAYSDSVLSAKYVASNYDADKSVQYEFGSATPPFDVGLLKAEGSFPEVLVNTEYKARADDVLATVGFTAYTDATLSIDKIRDMPIVTVNQVDQAYQREGTTLIQTNMPVLPGNDGAPVFNNEGHLIGFAVYGLLYCPDQGCFGTGTVRSVVELDALMKKNNVTLQTGAQSAGVWREGMDNYFRANYVSSTAAFDAAQGLYRFNRWAEPLKKLSSSLEGSPKDTTLWNQLQGIMIGVLVALVVATTLLAVVYKLQKRRMDLLRVGHYGAEASSAPNFDAPIITPVQTMGGNRPIYPSPTAPAAPPVPGVPVMPQTPMPGTPGQPVMPQQPPVQSPPVQQPPSGAVPPSEDPFYKQ